MRDPYNNDYYDEEEEEYVDEYEEREEEQEEVREPPKPTKEEKEFLSRRERLKEKFRQKLSKEMASTFGRSALRNTLKTSPQNKFGSFFGPSLPGIAPRVIEETKSLKENGYLHSSSKPSGSSTTNGAAPTSSGPKSSNGQTHRPKVVNEVKKKVEILKDNRDYSFLFSDDAGTLKETSTKSISQSKSDPSTSRPSLAKHIKEPSRGHLTGPNGKSASSTVGTTAQRHLQQQHPRQGNPAQRHPQQQLQRSSTSRQPPPQSNRLRPTPSGSHRPSPSTGTRAPTMATAANKASMKAVNDTSNHHPVVKKTTLNGTSNYHPTKSVNGINNYHPVVKKTSVSSNSRGAQVFSSVQRHPTEQKRIGSLSLAAKPSMNSTPPSKPQALKQTATSANGRVGEHGNKNIMVKKKPVAKRPFDDEEDNAIDLIRKMFNYNPNRWAGRDEDDSDMEVGFDVIQKEELLSSKIARKEDEEQLRLIEEEERREHMRKKQKQRHG